MNEMVQSNSTYYLDTVESQHYKLITVMLEKQDFDQGFGIAISGGNDNSSQRRGDTSIVVSDVLKSSAADTLVKINDVIVAINGTNVENVTHSFAVNLLRSQLKTVYLLLKRKDDQYQEIQDRSSHKNIGNVSIAMSSTANHIREAPVSSKHQYLDNQKIGSQNMRQVSTKALQNQGTTEEYDDMTVFLEKGKQGYGLYLGNLIFIKDKIEGTSAYRSDINIGDIIRKINDIPLESCKSTDDVLDIIKKSGYQLKLDVIRPRNIWLPTPVANKTYFYNVQEDNSKMFKKGIKSSSFKTPLYSGYENYETKMEGRDDDYKIGRSQSNDRQHNFTSLQIPKSYSTNKVDNKEIGGNNFQKSPYETKDNQYISDQIMPIINDVHKRNYKHPRSASTNAALSECRTVNLMAIDDQLGLQIIGGNRSGIFISSVMENGAADRVGLRVGDLIVMVNDVDFRHVTREEAVIVLLSFKNQPVLFKCINKLATYEKIRSQPGDDFYVRVNFDYSTPNNARELSLKKGELLHIRDTMYGGTIGSWSAVRISIDGKSGETGVVPNKSRAEQLSSKSKIEEKRNNEMKRRLRRGMNRQRQMNSRTEYQSQDKLDSISFAEQALQLSAYEKVSKGQAYFKRPVVLIGAASDVFKDHLQINMKDEFEIPVFPDSPEVTRKDGKFGKSIKLSNIKQVIEKDKHCILDLSEEGIQMLHHVNLCPIVILIKLANRKLSREFRAATVSMVYGSEKDNIDRKEARNIYRFGSKMFKKYPMLITAIIDVFDQPVNEIFEEIVNIIKARQTDPIFVSENDSDVDIIEAISFKGPNFESGFSTANESFTDDDGESIMHQDNFEDNKVFRQNRFQSSQQNVIASNNFSQAESIQRGRSVNITYDDDYAKADNFNVKSASIQNMRSNMSSYGSRKQSKISNINNSTIESWDMKNLNLSLKAVLKMKIDGNGGAMESPNTKVSIYVPPGAFNGQEREKEIFVKIYFPQEKTTNKIMLNRNCPVIVCGPSNINFLRPVEIRIPYNQEVDGRLDVKIKVSRSIDDDPKDWLPLALDYPGAAGNSFKISEEVTAILVERF